MLGNSWLGGRAKFCEFSIEKEAEFFAFASGMSERLHPARCDGSCPHSTAAYAAFARLIPAPMYPWKAAKFVCGCLSMAVTSWPPRCRRQEALLDSCSSD